MTGSLRIDGELVEPDVPHHVTIQSWYGQVALVAIWEPVLTWMWDRVAAARRSEHVHRLVRSPVATCKPLSHDSRTVWCLCILTGWLGCHWQPVKNSIMLRRSAVQTELMQRNKGSASGLESQLASGSSRAEALNAHEHEKHAASAHASTGSLLATWTRFFCAWLVPDVSIIPVGRRYENAWLSEFFQVTFLGPRKHWKQLKVRFLSHEARGRPGNQPRCPSRMLLI